MPAGLKHFIATLLRGFLLHTCSQFVKNLHPFECSLSAGQYIKQIEQRDKRTHLMLNPVTRSPFRILDCFVALLFLSVSATRVDAIEIPAGSNVTLSAAVSGLAPFVYKWYKNGVLIYESSESSLLYVDDFQSSNSGNYQVRISNSHGETSSGIVPLTLEGESAFASQPLAAGKDKFLGSVVASAVPDSFNSYWNQVTSEDSGTWGSVEATRNKMNWTALDAAYKHAKSNGFKFKLHTLIWGAQYPAWITGLSESQQRTEIEGWMTQLAARYPDLWAIEVVNEPLKTPLPFKNALGGDGTTGWDWVITSFQLARTKFPNAKLFINEYGTENDATARNQMIAIINLLKARNLIDGVGIQAQSLSVDSMTAAQMKTCLDAYATTGIDLYITELSIRGPLQTEASQSAQYQAIFPTIWTHAAVKGVTLSGYIEGQTSRAGTGLLNSDGTERAALRWLRGYLNPAPTSPTAPAPSNPAPQSPAGGGGGGGGGGGAPSLWFIGLSGLALVARTWRRHRR
jgi:endo-1,4-beta-xylanase